MSVFGMNVKAQVLDEGLNRLGKWKVELVLVMAMILLAWLDSSQAGESLNFIIDQLIGLSPYLLVSIGLTAYEISACLVGSEMCIRDSSKNTHRSTF